jgi:hypothetical protein
MRKQLVVLATMFAVVLCALTAWGAPFNATGSLTTARDSHTATAIAGGKVLVTGGLLDGSAVVTTELFDPAAGTWSAGANLQGPRAYHTATLLNNGKVLIAGGFTGSGASRSAELYDPAAGTTTATGNMATPRYYHTATLLADGKVLVAGGTNYSTDLATAEIYDPAAGTFTATGNLISACEGHTATLLSDSSVLILGGSNNGVVTGAGMYFVPASGTFSLTIPGGTTVGALMSRARTLHTATLLPNGKILIVGGSNGTADWAAAEIFDPAATGTDKPYSSTGSMAAARDSHTATMLPNGKVLIAGGWNGTASLNSAELYDPASGTFSAAAGSMNAARAYHTATLLPSGNVLLAGGFDGSADLASAEVYLTWPAEPARTGQTSCWDAAGTLLASCSGTGQTGDTQAGVAWPTPRFTANSNGTVTDNLTGLIWLKNADCFSSQVWATAVSSANSLISGSCGLTDGSTAGQWRLPNVLELRSLVNEQQANPATWLNTQGFYDVQEYSCYWSSSTYAISTNYAWYVSMYDGTLRNYGKEFGCDVWPVRSGQ